MPKFLIEKTETIRVTRVYEVEALSLYGAKDRADSIEDEGLTPERTYQKQLDRNTDVYEIKE